MTRVEPNRGSDEKRQTEQGRRDQHPKPDIGHTPGKAEGDEKTVDDALNNQEKRR
jgi:hypothetical protein